MNKMKTHSSISNFANLSLKKMNIKKKLIPFDQSIVFQLLPLRNLFLVIRRQGRKLKTNQMCQRWIRWIFGAKKARKSQNKNANVSNTSDRISAFRSLKREWNRGNRMKGFWRNSLMWSQHYKLEDRTWESFTQSIKILKEWEGDTRSLQALNPKKENYQWVKGEISCLIFLKTLEKMIIYELFEHKKWILLVRNAFCYCAGSAFPWAWSLSSHPMCASEFFFLQFLGNGVPYQCPLFLHFLTLFWLTGKSINEQIVTSR